MRVLIVDDEELVRITLGTILRRFSIDVVLAGHGVEALEILREETVDLVIVDYIMPGMNGLELIEKIRATQPELKAVMTSAYLREQIDCLGDIPFLQKPFNKEDVKKILEEMD